MINLDIVSSRKPVEDNTLEKSVNFLCVKLKAVTKGILGTANSLKTSNAVNLEAIAPFPTELLKVF